MTIVINLFGGPNSGKSTTASGVFYNLKLMHYHCEIVREYIKSWAWESRKPGIYDQPYIFGKQLKYESSLYGKVDYIITDSPLVLSAFYEELYEGSSIVKISAVQFMDKAKKNGVVYKNYWLPTVHNIDTRGRFGDQKQFHSISDQMKIWLTDNNIDFTELDNLEGTNRVDEILRSIR